MRASPRGDETPSRKGGAGRIIDVAVTAAREQVGLAVTIKVGGKGLVATPLRRPPLREGRAVDLVKVAVDV